MTVSSLYIEITNLCNLNCATCYNRSGLNQTRSEFSPELLRSTIRFFLPMGLSRVIFSGGEPTLHSRFGEVTSLCGEFPNLTFGMTTNGTVHHEALLHFLTDHDNTDLQISLDGSSEAVNALTRGPGNFAKALTLMESIHAAGISPGRLKIKTVLSGRNLADIEDYFSLAVQNGFTPDFAFAHKSGNAQNDWDSFSLTSDQKQDAIRRIAARAKKYGLEILLPNATTGCPYAVQDPSLSLAINYHGFIQPCQLLYDSRYAIGDIHHLDASLLTQGIRRIQDVAKARLTRDYGCGKCMLNSGCGRGCMALALLECGDITGCDGQCRERKQDFIRESLLQSVTNQANDSGRD
ncbi:MAG: radical SAM protein [Clostridia bacterium]|nr:radical SAM protein [Clostridia bacterium]